MFVFGVQEFGIKLGSSGSVFEDTGMTLLDLKIAKMVTGTEEGMTVRKFLTAAKPSQLIDLNKLHIKVSRVTRFSTCQQLTAHLVSTGVRLTLSLFAADTAAYDVAHSKAGKPMVATISVRNMQTHLWLCMVCTENAKLCLLHWPAASCEHLTPCCASKQQTGSGVHGGSCGGHASAEAVPEGA